MAIKIKAGSSIADKYASRAGAASADYTSGVQNPRTSWAAATAASSDAYAAGVQQAISNGRFEKGVAKTGDAGWQAKAASVGAQRYSSGVQAGKSNYASRVQPFLDTISNLTLPPRMPKGDPANLQRVQAVTQALRQKKLNG